MNDNVKDVGVLLNRDKMKLLEHTGNEKLWLFSPSVFRLYPKSGNMHEMGIKQTLRFLLMLIHGYRVYVMTDENDVVKGSITYQRGGSYRYPFARKTDIIDGPSYTVPKFRGQGVAVRIAERAMNEYEKSDVCYGTIQKDNYSSLKRTEKSDFKKVGKLRVDIFKRFINDPEGNIVLVAHYNRVNGGDNFQ